MHAIQVKVPVQKTLSLIKQILLGFRRNLSFLKDPFFLWIPTCSFKSARSSAVIVVQKAGFLNTSIETMTSLYSREDQPICGNMHILIMIESYSIGFF